MQYVGKMGFPIQYSVSNLHINVLNVMKQCNIGNLFIIIISNISYEYLYIISFTIYCPQNA